MATADQLLRSTSYREPVTFDDIRKVLVLDSSLSESDRCKYASRLLTELVTARSSKELLHKYVASFAGDEYASLATAQYKSVSSYKIVAFEAENLTSRVSLASNMTEIHPMFFVKHIHSLVDLLYVIAREILTVQIDRMYRRSLNAWTEDHAAVVNSLIKSAYVNGICRAWAPSVMPEAVDLENAGELRLMTTGLHQQLWDWLRSWDEPGSGLSAHINGAMLTHRLAYKRNDELYRILSTPKPDVADIMHYQVSYSAFYQAWVALLGKMYSLNRVRFLRELFKEEPEPQRREEDPDGDDNSKGPGGEGDDCEDGSQGPQNEPDSAESSEPEDSDGDSSDDQESGAADKGPTDDAGQDQDGNDSSDANGGEEDDTTQEGQDGSGAGSDSGQGEAGEQTGDGGGGDESCEDSGPGTGEDTGDTQDAATDESGGESEEQSDGWVEDFLAKQGIDTAPNESPGESNGTYWDADSATDLNNGDAGQSQGDFYANGAEELEHDERKDVAERVVDASNENAPLPYVYRVQTKPDDVLESVGRLLPVSEDNVIAPMAVETNRRCRALSSWVMGGLGGRLLANTEGGVRAQYTEEIPYDVDPVEFVINTSGLGDYQWTTYRHVVHPGWHVFVDVSGTMMEYLAAGLTLMRALEDHAESLYQFSGRCFDVTDLDIPDIVITTKGTLLDPILDVIEDREIQRAVVFTDNLFYQEGVDEPTARLDALSVQLQELVVIGPLLSVKTGPTEPFLLRIATEVHHVDIDTL